MISNANSAWSFLRFGRLARVGFVVPVVVASVTMSTAAATPPPRLAGKSVANVGVSQVASAGNRGVFGDHAAGSSDVALDGWGDSEGYHVEVGRETAGFAWSEVAVLRPTGLGESSWTGYQCLSGDGRYAAVAILPASLVNLAVARDRGAYAFSVDLASGQVRPIASGVGLKYFSPGCGIGDTAAFTLNLGSDESSSEVVTADLATGAVMQTVQVPGQVTSAIPTPAGVVGVMASRIVALTAAGKMTVLASAPGDVFDLRPATDGGLSFLTTTAGSTVSTAMHEKNGVLTTLGSGPLTKVQLFAGRAGHAVLAGTTTSDADAASVAGVRVVSDAGLPVTASGASLDGDALIGDQSGTTTGTAIKATASGNLLMAAVATSGARVTLTKASYVPSGVLGSVPAPRSSLGHIQPRGDVKPSSLKTAPTFAAIPHTATSSLPANSAGTAAGGVSPAVAQSPVCAVPPLDPGKQVMQPSPKQADWASQMLEQGLLTGSAYTRPANYDNMGFAAYAPSSDFPPITLLHPSTSTWNSVPRSVYDAIMAQESNFSQASWHAPEGTAGDPLIADYYGRGNGITSINYAGADCGYGIGQVTDGMRADETGQLFSARGQVKIAVDYQENIAAGLQILEGTWNQLYTDGIIANNGDPQYLENWFFAAWAYNSGIQPTGTYNTTGCTPGPTCTGPDGTWGMGWANNPENLAYPPNRLPYLKATYADAAHPSSWPYEERVMGWMASPIQRDNGSAYSTPTYHNGNTWVQNPPFATFCNLAANHCNPSATNTSNPDAGHCMLNDYECWWHAPATWIGTCATTCATAAYQYSGGSEPVNTNSNPVMCSLDTSKVPSSAIIVDDQPSPNNLNLQGCSSANENWSSNGTFTYSPGTNANGDPIGNIDTHQLGSGFGGRILFTHTEDGTNTDLINTGTWTPNLPSLQYYKIKIHLPALGATTTNVVYTINPGGGAAPWKIRVNQDWNSDQWVTIGTFAMQNGGNVVLTNKSPVVDTGDTNNFNFDVAYDAVAFVPQGGTPGTPIGGPPTVQDEPKGSNPAFIQCGCAQRTAGDPVNTQTGYYSETDTDLTTPGRGMALNFSRTYTEATADPNGPNKTLAVNGPFGYGWTDSYNLSTITNGSTGAVTVVQEDSSRVIFNFNSTNGTYSPAELRDDATLTKSGTTYTYTRHGRDIFLFDAATGHLSAEQDLAGAHASAPYKTSLAYNSSGQLWTITDPDNRVYTLTWTGGHITQLQDGAGRTVTYAYDTSNDLTGVYAVGTTRSPSVLNDDLTTYGYNTTTHVMSGFRTPKNQGGASTAHVSMTYDSSERVYTQTDAVGRVTTFNYGPSTTPSLLAGQTLVTDPSAHQTLDTYQGGLLISETKGYGSTVAATWKYTYDPVSLGVTTMSDPAGNLSTYSYDDHGNKISSSDPDGHVTNYVYNAAGELTETIDPTGVATVNLYDQAGHISTGTGTTNNGTFTYGDLTSTTVTQANNVAESTTGNFGPAPTRTTNFYYDDAAHPGDRYRVIDPRGFTMTSYYDAAGDVRKTFDTLNNTTVYAWDLARGWRTSAISPRGVAAGVSSCAPLALGCTLYSYDAWGHIKQTTDALGHTSMAVYDADGNKTSETDADNNTTQYVYDPAEQLFQTKRADGTVTSAQYNGDGTLHITTDAANHNTTYGYDAQGRQTTVTDPDNHITTTGYNTVGYVSTVKDNLARTTTNTVDPAGRITAVSYSDAVTPNITNISYDGDNRRTSMTDGSGQSTWLYDTFGELHSYTNGAGSTVGYGYDADGNQTSITYPDGRTVTNGYDNDDRLTSVLDGSSHTTTFGYNQDSQLATTTYPAAATVTDGFNNADQLTTITVNQGTTSLGALTYTPDNAGQVSTVTPSGGLPGPAQTFHYTQLNQVKSSTTGTTTTGYGYDNANNITTNAGTTAQFDAANQLCWSTTAAITGTPTCTTPPTGATAYTYNTVGQRTKTTPSAGTTNTYNYNQAGVMTSASVNGVATNMTYNGDSLRTKLVTGTTTTMFTYGQIAGSTALLTNGATDYIYGPGGTPIEQISSTATNYFVHDRLGSTVALLTTAGAIAGTYTYNTYGKATAHTGTASTPLAYGGGYTDTTLGLIYLQHRYYDPTTAQFMTVDPALAKTGQPYAYTGNNPLNETDSAGLAGCGILSIICNVVSDSWHSYDDTMHGLSDYAGAVATHTADPINMPAYYSVCGSAWIVQGCLYYAPSNGDLYGSGGVGLSTPWPTISEQAGYIYSDSNPSGADVNSYLTGPGVSAGGGAGLSGNGVYGRVGQHNKQAFGWEQGVSTPGAGIYGSYTWNLCHLG